MQILSKPGFLGAIKVRGKGVAVIYTNMTMFRKHGMVFEEKDTMFSDDEHRLTRDMFCSPKQIG